ncbi:MAG: LysR substrate-binding domain-containing protein [Burkholderiaceae bacterium]
MRRKIPSLQALACFDAAARHESYTRAAQELALTQSAVSRQIGGLEEFLGQPLFRRTRHGVALTERGTDYARAIAPRLHALERDTLEAMSGQGAGRSIALAAVPTFAGRWLIPRLPALALAHPELVVHIETRTRPFLFADTEFDAALYAGTPEQIANWAGTRSALLMDEALVPVCAPSLLPTARALSPLQLAKLPLLQQSTRPHAWRQWFDAVRVPAPYALAGPRYELFSLTVAAAACGLGVALAPRLLVESELARGELVVACRHSLQGERAYYLVTPERSDAKAALAPFSAWLLRAARPPAPARTAHTSPDRPGSPSLRG